MATRKITFFHKLASLMTGLGLTPNMISICSSIFALLGGVCFVRASEQTFTLQITLLIAAILTIQLRLICNLTDGLMAVECGLKTASGEIFNDVPDRISDVAFIIGAGIFAQSYATWIIHVAWIAALFAVMTAYVRVLGTSLSGTHDFSGPMAKQHRMFLLTVGAIGGLVEAYFKQPAYCMSAILCLIAIGSAFTCARRLRRLYCHLERKI